MIRNFPIRTECVSPTGEIFHDRGLELTRALPVQQAASILRDVEQLEPQVREAESILKTRRQREDSEKLPLERTAGAVNQRFGARGLAQTWRTWRRAW